MPPKNSTKTKDVKPEPTTPKPKVKPDPEVAETPKKTPSTSARKPKLTAPPRNYKKLVVEEGVTASIDIKYEGTQQAVAQTGGFSMMLRLEAQNAFTLVKTTVLTEGPFAGHQAILLRPAKPFKFMDLPPAAKNAVYRMYFSPKGLTEATTPIVIDGKRAVNKAPYSKSYAEGSKNRVGLLAVCKEVNAEASAVLYGRHPLRFESTDLLRDFLVENKDTRDKISNVEVKLYKKQARLALTLLAESTSLRRLKLESGVTTDGDIRKAAKAFYLDAAQLLDAVGKQKQDKDAGVDLLEFPKGALTAKSGDKIKLYNEEAVAQFIQELKKLCN